MSNIIETYKIQFLRREIIGKFHNIMNSVSSVLDQLMEGYLTPDLINQFLIGEINKVLSGVLLSETIISETMVAAVIEQHDTNLYQDVHYNPTSSPDFSLPTADFIAITQAWFQFVISNPPTRSSSHRD